MPTTEDHCSCLGVKVDVVVAMFQRIHDRVQATQKGPAPSDNTSSPSKFGNEALMMMFRGLAPRQSQVQEFH